MVLPTRMNPDLAMGDELLKKTGAGNLFMVFGEPDVEIKKQKDDTLIAEIKGVDVYDPTTGEIRSASTDDIACWFIDTDYNGESFFVRHAYFTGADEPYDKLKRALRAEIDEAAWSESLQHYQPSIREAADRQDCCQGDQPLRGRGAEGVRGLVRDALILVANSKANHSTAIPLRSIASQLCAPLGIYEKEILQ